MLIDLSGVPKQLREKIDEVIRKDYEVEVMTAMERQKRVAEFYYKNQPRAVDGIGEQTMALDPVFDAMWRAKMGHDCWDDHDFRKWFLKHSEDARVKSGGTGKIMVGYRGGVSASREARFKKTYGP